MGFFTGDRAAVGSVFSRRKRRARRLTTGWSRSAAKSVTMICAEVPERGSCGTGWNPSSGRRMNEWCTVRVTARASGDTRDRSAPGSSLVKVWTVSNSRRFRGRPGSGAVSMKLRDGAGLERAQPRALQPGHGVDGVALQKAGQIDGHRAIGRRLDHFAGPDHGRGERSGDGVHLIGVGVLGAKTRHFRRRRKRGCRPCGRQQSAPARGPNGPGPPRPCPDRPTGPADIGNVPKPRRRPGPASAPSPRPSADPHGPQTAPVARVRAKRRRLMARRSAYPSGPPPDWPPSGPTRRRPPSEPCAFSSPPPSFYAKSS